MNKLNKIGIYGIEDIMYLPIYEVSQYKDSRVLMKRLVRGMTIEISHILNHTSILDTTIDIAIINKIGNINMKQYVYTLNNNLIMGKITNANILLPIKLIS